jgi:hypothetical protein
VSLDRASPETRRWIKWLRGELSQLDYTDTQVWADFRNSRTGHVIAHLRPSKSHVVSYLKLDSEDDPDLAPARTDWDFPFTFTVRGEGDLAKARDLILRSDERYVGLVEAGRRSR